MAQLNDVVRQAGAAIIGSARLLERRRFEFLFGDGAVTDVVAALRPYRNPDGGFGNALEPDCRAPGSQPVTTMYALSVLDEVGMDDELVPGACDYLDAIAADDGGAPFVHPSAAGFARAPWWQVPDTYAGSLIPTGGLVGLLHRNKVDHPWVERATKFCWARVEAVADLHPYGTLSAIAFLDAVPDRARAERVAARWGDAVRAAGLVSTAVPDGDGDVWYPHDFAGSPESLARQWFSADELVAGLDLLAAGQRGDGTWPVRWEIWHPVVEHEWLGPVTIDALRVLRAYGRIG